MHHQEKIELPQIEKEFIGRETNDTELTQQEIQNVQKLLNEWGIGLDDPIITSDLKQSNKFSNFWIKPS